MVFVASADSDFAGKTLKLNDILDGCLFFSQRGMPITGRPWISSWHLRSRPCHRCWRSATLPLSSVCWKKNHGLSFLPYLAVERDIRKGRIALLHVEDVEISMYRQIFYHKNKFKTREMEEFIRLAAE